MRYLESIFLGLSVNEHYQSISRGVLDTRDLVYFISFVFFFLGITKLVIGGRKW
jgi:ABC-2 type transport system permease protein